MGTAVERSLLKDSRLTLGHDGLQATRLRLLGPRKCTLLFSAHKVSKTAPARPTLRRLAAGSVAKFVAVSLGMELLRVKRLAGKTGEKASTTPRSLCRTSTNACESDENGDNGAVEVDIRTDSCFDPRYGLLVQRVDTVLATPWGDDSVEEINKPRFPPQGPLNSFPRTFLRSWASFCPLTRGEG
jgi:hypothetical protein